MRPYTPAVPQDPLAVVDVGSNSGRLVVLRVGPAGHLEVLADGRAPLRLARDLRDGRTLSEAAIRRTVETLKDFRAMAEGAGAARTVAVATSAMRESDNADELIERVKAESGLAVVVIDGGQEARYGFLAAVQGLPVQNGLMMDIGGGSVEVTRFRDRRSTASWTLPLGSLRLSDRFLASDPPSSKEVEALRGWVATTLSDSGIEQLGDDERLIATGGTVRNLAKIDRHSRSYPIPRIHGYVLTRRRAQDLADLLAGRRLARRRSTPGLNADRADSIVGGALVAVEVMDVIGASEVTISGQGLREGLAFHALEQEPPSVEEVRRASVEAMAARFATWDERRARRRAAVAEVLVDALLPDAGANVRERIGQAALLLDIGRSIDYYRRFEHTADVVTEGDLLGFTHRKIALLSAVIRQAGDESSRVQRYAPLLSAADKAAVAREATILSLADEIEHRLAPDSLGTVACEDRGRTVVLDAPVFDPWAVDEMATRFRRAFAKRLTVRPPTP